MSRLPEQFSAARTSPLDAQFSLIRAMTRQAFANAEQLIALNFSATRASLAQSSAVLKQVIAAREPRDLLDLSQHGQQQVANMLAYARALTRIAASDLPMPALPAPAPGATPLARIAAPAAPSVKPPKHLVIEAEPAPTPVPVAQEKPIARAVAEVADTPILLPVVAEAAFPVAVAPAPIAQQLLPIEAAVPPAPVSGTPAGAPKKSRSASKLGKKK